MSERHGGEVVQGIAPARLRPVEHAGDLVTVDEHVGDLQVAVREDRCPRPERGLGDLAVARDQVGGKDAAGDEPLAFLSRRDADSSILRPGHGGSGASCSLRAAAPAAAHAADDAVDGSPRRPSAIPGEGGEREHGRLPPQDLRGRDRRHRHRLDLDVDARLIGVDLQEYVTDTERRALAMGDDDLDLVHAGHYRGVVGPPV